MPRLHLLGGLRAFAADRELASLPAQKIRCGVLVYVATEGETTRDALLGTLWPDRDPDRARHALNQTLYELRKTLGADWVQTAGDRLSLSSHVQVDTHLLEEAARLGDYRIALELYRGEFLANTYLVESHPFEEWCERHRQRLKRLHRKCVREAMRDAATRGDSAAALDIASATAEVDPLDDEMQHERIRLLAEAGRPSEALQVFRRYEELLTRENLKPLEETLQVVQRIRLGSLDRPRPAVTEPDAKVETPVPAPGPVLDDELGSPEPPPPLPWWKRRARALALSGLAALSIVSWIAVKRPDNAVTGSAPPRIAVLFFNDNSRAHDLGYLANGLTEDLISALHSVPGLTVLSMGAVAPYRGNSVAHDSIAHALRASYLISGSVDSVSGGFRARVELADGQTGDVIATGDVATPSHDYYAVRDQIATKVVDLLRKELGSELRLRALRAETNAPALEFFHRAQEQRARANRQLRAGEEIDVGPVFLRADSLAAQAEARDRSWLRPIVLRGSISYDRAYHAMLTDTSDSRMRLLLDSARLHADRALAKNDSFPDARELRALTWFRLSSGPVDTAVANRMLADAEKDLLVAVSVEPTSSEAWTTLSTIAFLRGDFGRSLYAAKEAYNADAYLERVGEVLERLAIGSFETGNDIDARRWCDEGLNRFPNDFRFVQCHLLLQGWSMEPPNPAAARRLLDLNVRGEDDPWNRGYLEMLLAGVHVRAGQLDSARAIIRRARLHEPSNANLLWAEAANRVLLNERDRATALLRSYATQVPTRSANVLLSRMFTPLHDQPAFRELVRFYTPQTR